MFVFVRGTSDPLLFAVAFVVGAVAAAFANYCADRFAWEDRFRSPWRSWAGLEIDSKLVPTRRWIDYVPILGWFSLARIRRGAKKTDAVLATVPGFESNLFWLRPALVEFGFGLLVAFRCVCLRDVAGDAFPSVWIVETLLFLILLATALTDLDDYIISDELIVPGAIIGLLVAAFCRDSSLLVRTVWPMVGYDMTTRSVIDFLGALSERFLPNLMTTCPARVLSAEFACFFVVVWSFWNFALLDRRFYPRLGLKRAFAIFFRRIRRSPLTPVVAVVWTIGIVALLLASTVCANEETIEFLALSLIGLLFGVVLIWAVRLIGGASLGLEAMGFGDVLLVGVIGAFIGWQGVLVVFFIAPFIGVVFGLVRRCFNSNREIPYGPSLSLATVFYACNRERFNEALAPYFEDVGFLALIGICGFALFTIMLIALRLIRR